MANNQYVNKVIFGNETLIDLTGDTVGASVLQAGYTAHDSSGQPITGILTTKAPSTFDFSNGIYTITLDRGIYGGIINLPGIRMTIPSSGTNEFYIEFPDNAAPASDADWTKITFSVDSSGNSSVTDDTIPASGVSF